MCIQKLDIAELNVKMQTTTINETTTQIENNGMILVHK